MTRTRTIAAIALGMSALAATPAHAAFYVDLKYETNTPGTGHGNVFKYTVTDGSETLNVWVTAWSINSRTASSAIVQNATVKDYGDSGLGLINREPSSGDVTSPEHAIDNKDWTDFLLFQFDRAVDLDKFTIGWASSDADVTIRYGNVGGAWNATPGLHNQPYATLTGLLPNTFDALDDASPYTGEKDFTGSTNDTANWWMISALYPEAGYDKDYFKLRAITVTAPPGVPEPATWLMMIAGFGAIGAGLRRKARVSYNFA